MQQGGAMLTAEQSFSRASSLRRIVIATALMLLALVAWWLIYRRLAWFSEWYTYVVLRYPHTAGDVRALPNGCCGTVEIAPGEITAGVRTGRAIAFLLFQIPHTLMLLSLVVFLMGIVRSFFTVTNTRRFLAGRGAMLGIPLAALLGVVTPFCSCSAVPLFIGFVTAGVPLAITFTFLTAAPLVNEIALALLIDQFGWRIAGLYLGVGLLIALLTGWIIGRLRMERYLEDWVREIEATTDAVPDEHLGWIDRIHAGLQAWREILGRVWLYVLIGIVAGAFIHVYVSQDQLIALLGKQHWWSVPLAAVIGVPIYSNPAGVLPVVDALLHKGVPMGTVLAFMMAVTALSLPEFIILRRVVKLRLIFVFAGIVTLGIIVVGVLFNLLT